MSTKNKFKFEWSFDDECLERESSPGFAPRVVGMLHVELPSTAFRYSTDTKESTNLLGIAHWKYAKLHEHFAAILNRLYNSVAIPPRDQSEVAYKVIWTGCRSTSFCVGDLYMAVSVKPNNKYLCLVCKSAGGTIYGTDYGFQEGIVQFIFNGRVEFPVDQFRTRAKILLDELLQGWEQSKLSLYPEICYRLSENDYQLYVKKKYNGLNAAFIRNLVAASEAPYVHCYDSIIDNSYEIVPGDFMYLWKPKVLAAVASKTKDCTRESL
jgi:hypothetical protein